MGLAQEVINNDQTMNFRSSWISEKSSVTDSNLADLWEIAERSLITETVIGDYCICDE